MCWPGVRRRAAKAEPALTPGRGAAQRRRLDELLELAEACKGRYRDVVPVLALAGLRWGELAGLQVGDRVSVPGPGLRLRRAVLASSGGGALYVDTLKNNRARTVPLVLDLVPIVDRWSEGKAPDAWLFAAPEGGPLRESNWKRGRLGCCHFCCRAARVPRPRSASYGSVGVAGCWRGPEGGTAGAGTRHSGDDDGPVRPHGGCQLVAGGTAHRGHLGDI